jgi:hypothetical protein
LYLWNKGYFQWKQFAVLARYFRFFLAVFVGYRSLLFRRCRRGKSEDFRGELCLPAVFPLHLTAITASSMGRQAKG